MDAKKIARLKKEIENGNYETIEKLLPTIDALIEDIKCEANLPNPSDEADFN